MAVPHFALRRPIGVFDSGVGGLTVLKELRRSLPGRDFLYVGDTSRVPYGRKPKEMVAEFATEIADFLCRRGVEAIVVACNTASAAALPMLSDRLTIPVWGVIEPGVAAAIARTKSRSVGVIGTKSTISSGAYQSRLEAAGLRVWSQPCPLFVHLVEEGLADSDEARLLAKYYLGSHPEIDTLILGCTHYPVLHSVIQEAIGAGVSLVGSAEATAEVVRQTIVDECGGVPGRIVHYVTGDPLAYRHTAEVIGGVDGEIVPLPISMLAE